MEPLLKDTSNRGHHRKYLSTKDTFGGTKNGLSYCSNAFSPLKSGQPLYSGQISWSQCILYTEVSLYVCITVCMYVRTYLLYACLFFGSLTCIVD